MKILERDGWVLQCPFCKSDIRYTLINNQNIPVPFFYAEDGNDILLRKSDALKCDVAIEKTSHRIPDVNILEELWLSILRDAPDAPCGGHFSLWANVKCPSCKKEIPYNNGVKNLSVRINEPKIVLVDGAIIVGDTEADTWKTCVQTSK